MKPLLAVAIFFTLICSSVTAAETETFGVIVDKQNGLMLWLTNANEQKNCPDRQEKVVIILDKGQKYCESGCWRVANKKMS